MPAKFPDGSALKRYDLPSVGAEGWASIVIGADGFLASVGDFYDFAHHWPHFGNGDFRSFLIATQPEQLLSKIARKTEYDGEATVQQIKQAIVGMRRRKEVSKEVARDEWNAIKYHSVEQCTENFLAWFEDSSVDDVEGYFMHYGYPLAAQHFIRQTWPRFVEMLRRELAAEAKNKAVLDALPPGDAGGNI